jgi:hypothetical protein
VRSCAHELDLIRGLSPCPFGLARNVRMPALGLFRSVNMPALKFGELSLRIRKLVCQPKLLVFPPPHFEEIA